MSNSGFSINSDDQNNLPITNLYNFVNDNVRNKRSITLASLLSANGNTPLTLEQLIGHVSMNSDPQKAQKVADAIIKTDEFGYLPRQLRVKYLQQMGKRTLSLREAWRMFRNTTYFLPYGGKATQALILDQLNSSKNADSFLQNVETEIKKVNSTFVMEKNPKLKKLLTSLWDVFPQKQSNTTLPDIGIDTPDEIKDSKLDINIDLKDQELKEKVKKASKKTLEYDPTISFEDFCKLSLNHLDLNTEEEKDTAALVLQDEWLRSHPNLSEAETKTLLEKATKTLREQTFNSYDDFFRDYDKRPTSS